MASQSYTYSFVNAQSYLDELNKPSTNQSHENTMIVSNKPGIAASKSSHRAMTYGNGSLQIHTENPFS